MSQRLSAGLLTRAEGKSIMFALDLLTEQVQRLQLMVGQPDFLIGLRVATQYEQQAMQVDNERPEGASTGLRHAKAPREVVSWEIQHTAAK